MEAALRSFLYVLMRDHLTCGVVEQLVTCHVEKARGREPVYSNPHLAAYASELSERILANPIVVKDQNEEI